MGASTSSSSRGGTHSSKASGPYLVDSETHIVRANGKNSTLEFLPLARHHPEEVQKTKWWGIRPTIIPRMNRSRDGSDKRDPAAEISHSALVHQRVIRMGRQIRYSDIHWGVVLGAGTYGEVSSATLDRRTVAVKKIFSGTTPVETEEVYNDFKREVRILQRIKHDRVVLFHGFVEEIGAPYCLVFEKLEGNVATLLRAVRKDQVAITFRVCLGIAKDAAQAVGYLHRRTPPILHRDLKAENLLLEGNFRCKLTDFGLSRTFSADRPSKMTVCGTPSWVAPEVFRGEEYSEKVDVYSFGILLWEIFAGRKPYGDKNSVDLPYLVGTEGLRPPRMQHIPDALWNLMEMCWKEEPEQRPSFGRVEERLVRISEIINEVGKLGSAVHGDNLAQKFPKASKPQKLSPLNGDGVQQKRSDQQQRLVLV